MRKRTSKSPRLNWLLANLFGILLIAVVLGTAFVVWNRSRQHAVNIAAMPLSHERFEAVSAKLVGLMGTQDPSASFAYLRDLSAKDVSVARDCHPLLHHLGRAAYKKYGTFSTAMTYQDTLCNSGYTHGVLEAYFLAAPDARQALQAACTGLGDATFQAWQCYHGTGHGVMFVMGKDLDKSLMLCQEHASDFARNSCANGVFMERFVVVSHMGGAVPNADVIQTGLCESQLATYKPDCYFYAPTAYLTRHQNAYDGAFRDCKQAEAAYRKYCMQGVGSQAMKDNITRPEIGSKVCNRVPREYVVACVRGAVGILVNNYGTTRPVAPLCSTVFGRYEAECKQLLLDRRSQFSQFE